MLGDRSYKSHASVGYNSSEVSIRQMGRRMMFNTIPNGTTRGPQHHQ